jgi:ParB family chromosome partitioning protein
VKILNAGQVIRLPLDQITVGKRLRRVSPVQVQTLILMAEDTGITTPIHVRKTRDGHELIDGAHRLAAAMEMGLSDIACLVVECRQDEARQMEASNNLGAARMTPLQTARFAASWKRDYYAANPKRAKDVFKGNQHTGSLVSDIMSLTRSIAQSFGTSERHVKRILAVGERLSDDEAGMLDAAERPLSMKDLADLAKVNDPAIRAAVVQKLALGAAKSVGQARRAVAEETGEAPAMPPADPVEDALKALSKLWSRAPKDAKRRFADRHAHELADLLGFMVDDEQGEAA